MTVSKISFSSETPILSSMHNKTAGTASNPAPVQQNPVNTTPEQTTAPAVDNAAPENSNDHTFRNCPVGLSAATVLTTLGVVSNPNAAGRTPKVTGDTTLDRDAINAKLDRTLPKIDAPLTIKIPDTLEGIDISGMKGGEFKIFELPNGHRKSVRLNDDGSFIFIIESDSKGIDLWCDNWLDVKRLQFTKYVGNKEYSYEPNGKLASIAELNEKGKPVRVIHVKEGTSDITAISHKDAATNKWIKQDNYKNNKLVSEEFYGADGEDVITTVIYE